MSVTDTPHFVFHSPPFFSANWLGRHPHDDRPRLVVCFGPSLPDDFAALQAGVLGLESVLQKSPPPVTLVRAELDEDCLVLYSQDHELVRTEPLSEALVKLVRWRPEVLLVWVDVPLTDPQAELSAVQMQHVWTGLASVHGNVW